MTVEAPAMVQTGSRGRSGTFAPCLFSLDAGSVVDAQCADRKPCWPLEGALGKKLWELVVSDERRDVRAAVARVESGEALVQLPVHWQSVTSLDHPVELLLMASGAAGRTQVIARDLASTAPDRSAQSEILRRADLKILKLIAACVPLQDVLEALIQVAEEQAEGTIGSVLFVEDGVLRHAAAPGLPAAFLSAIDGVPISATCGSCGTAAYRRAVVIVEDIATDPLWADFRQLALKAGLRACWSVPIFGSDQSVLGTFAYYYRTPRRPTPESLELIDNQSHLAAIAIERWRTEQAIEQQRQALVESEARARLVVENALDANILMDSDGIITGWNPMAVKIFGFLAHEAIGRRLEELIIPPRLRAQHVRGLRRYLATGEHALLGRRIQVSALHKQGLEFPIELAITPIRIGGSVIFSAFLADITEQNRKEDELRQLQKLDAIGQLTGSVAHDFNNILSVIAAYAESVHRSLNGNDPLRGDVEEIIKAGKRAASLTRQLLAFGRKQTLQPIVLDLNHVISELGNMLGRLLREDIQLTTTLAKDLWPIKADPGQLEQVMVNLAVNARDAMPEGGKLSIETANVELGQEGIRAYGDLKAGPYVMLSVADTGCGMDAETKRRIFEPFFTTKDKDKGTGLGLSTVYGVVKQSGGHIAVFSEPDKGATFKLYFARALAQPALSVPPRSDRAPSAVMCEHVLLVEDEPALRKICERMLKTLKCRVTTCANGGEALLAVEERGLRPDLLVTDMVMPGMSGKTLAARLRKTQPALKVLYMSGYTDESIAEGAALPDGSAFLQKPFRIDELAARVALAMASAT